MRKRQIKLNPQQAKEFVTTSSKCDFDIDVFYNRVIIDAKSMLGVLGLDFTKTLTVQYQGYDSNFEQLSHNEMQNPHIFERRAGRGRI